MGLRGNGIYFTIHYEPPAVRCYIIQLSRRLITRLTDVAVSKRITRVTEMGMETVWESTVRVWPWCHYNLYYRTESNTIENGGPPWHVSIKFNVI